MSPVGEYPVFYGFNSSRYTALHSLYYKQLFRNDNNDEFCIFSNNEEYLRGQINTDYFANIFSSILNINVV